MNRDEAASLLKVSADASEVELFRAYRAQRDRLGTQLKEAPTPRFQQRARDAINHLEEARRTLGIGDSEPRPPAPPAKPSAVPESPIASTQAPLQTASTARLQTDSPDSGITEELGRLRDEVDRLKQEVSRKSDSEAESFRPSDILETCTHCQRRVLFASDYCPSCKRSRKDGTLHPSFNNQQANTSARQSIAPAEKMAEQPPGVRPSMILVPPIFAMVFSTLLLYVSMIAVHEATRSWEVRGIYSADKKFVALCYSYLALPQLLLWVLSFHFLRQKRMRIYFLFCIITVLVFLIFVFGWHRTYAFRFLLGDPGHVR